MKKILIYAELIELRAKSASLFPFLLGVLYSYNKWGSIRAIPSFLLIIAMFLFNSAVDILDNYCDYKNSDDVNYKNNVNIIGRCSLNLDKLKKVIIFLIAAAALIGVILAYFSNMLLIPLGIYSFAVGVFYSYGKRPLSSLPLGEFFSGTTMGYIIILITVIVNHTIAAHDYLNVFIYSLPSVFSISSLMLVNNICDIDEDRINGRLTLPILIGKNMSLLLLCIFYIGSITFMVINVILKLAPGSYLLSLTGVIPIYFNTKRIIANPIKKEAFPYAVRNTIVLLGFQVVYFILGYFVKLPIY